MPNGTAVCVASQVTAEQPAPVAIAEADATTAERLPRAEIELIVGPTMIRAIRTAAEGIIGAVVAESRRQRLRRLPIHLNHWNIRVRRNSLACGTGCSPSSAQEQNKSNGKRLHPDSPAKLLVIDGASGVSPESTDKAPRSFSRAARLIGSRT